MQNITKEERRRIEIQKIKNCESIGAVHTHTHTISLGKNIGTKNKLNKNKKYIK